MSTAATTSVAGFDPLFPQRLVAELPNELGPGMTTTFASPEIERRLQGDQRLLTLEEGVKALYLCQVPDNLFPVIFTKYGVFTDPAGHLEAKPPAGDATKNDGPFLAFKGLAELFRPTRLDKWQVVSVDPIKIEVEMAYQFRGPPASISPSIPFKTVLTLITNDADGRIKHLLDEWKGDRLLWEKDGFLGKLAEWRRAATGAAQKAFVGLTGGTSVQSSGLADPKVAKAVVGSSGQPAQNVGGSSGSDQRI